MSDFAISLAQRRRLLAGDYSALDFDTKPYGFEPGAVYVLAWQKATAVVFDDGEVARTPRRPVWFLTVTKVVRHRKGFWRAQIEVTDLRDRDLFLKRGGGYTSFDELRAGSVPRWTPSMLTRTKAVNEFWHAERLKRHAEELRERSRARRKRAA